VVVAATLTAKNRHSLPRGGKNSPRRVQCGGSGPSRPCGAHIAEFVKMLEAYWRMCRG